MRSNLAFGVIALAAALAVVTGPALAQDSRTGGSTKTGATITIYDPRWEKMSTAERNELVAKMREAGALGPDDKIVYKPRPPQTAGERGSLLSLLPLVGLICKGKNNAEAERCGALSGAAAEKCSAAEAERKKKSFSLCTAK